MKHILQSFAMVAGVLTMTNIRFQTDELKVGDQAPDFKLEASDGKTYRLADFKGKQAVVLAWFPKAFTGGCTMECRSLAANGDKIRQFDVSYFMISTDSIAQNKGFAEKEKADFPILSDPSRATAKAYGVVSKDTDSPKRWTFYIGKDGKIAAIDKAVKAATAAEDMIAKLDSLGVAKRK